MSARHYLSSFVLHARYTWQANEMYLQHTCKHETRSIEYSADTGELR
ncbi:MAG TPA: hypothetical protein VF600_05500 [Abditibacteriaceae bacterium]|jgi:hypothetical protein